VLLNFKVTYMQPVLCFILCSDYVTYFPRVAPTVPAICTTHCDCVSANYVPSAFFLIFSNQIVPWHRRTVKVKWSYLNSPTVDVGTGLELRQGCMCPEGGGGVKEEVTVGPV